MTADDDILRWPAGDIWGFRTVFNDLRPSDGLIYSIPAYCWFLTMIQWLFRYRYSDYIAAVDDCITIIQLCIMWYVLLCIITIIVWRDTIFIIEGNDYWPNDLFRIAHCGYYWPIHYSFVPSPAIILWILLNDLWPWEMTKHYNAYCV